MIYQIYSWLANFAGPLQAIAVMTMLPIISIGGILVWVYIKLDPGPPPEKSYDQLELEYSKMVMEAEDWMDEIHLERTGEKSKFVNGKLVGYGQETDCGQERDDAKVKYHHH